MRVVMMVMVLTVIVSGMTVLGGISSPGPQMRSTVSWLEFNCPRRGWLCEEARPGGQAVAYHAGLGQVNSELLVACYFIIESAVSYMAGSTSQVLVCWN